MRAMRMMVLQAASDPVTAEDAAIEAGRVQHRPRWVVTAVKPVALVQALPISKIPAGAMARARQRRRPGEAWPAMSLGLWISG